MHVCEGRDIATDYASGGRVEQRQQEDREEEVAQVVHCQLVLEAVLRLDVRPEHHSCSARQKVLES